MSTFVDSNDSRTGKPWPVPGLRISLDDIKISGKTAYFYDFHGDAYAPDSDPLLVRLIQLRVGYPVVLTSVGEGNGHFKIIFAKQTSPANARRS